MPRFIVLLFFLLVAPGSMFAQEVQVPFDSSGKIDVISSDIEQSLRLFPTYQHFLEARLFQQRDSSFILEVTSIVEGKHLRDRLPKTRQDVTQLRHAVDSLASERSLSVFLDQNSRSKFLVYETLFGTFVYGPFIIAASNPSGSAGTGIELVIGGLGYLIPSALTQNSTFTDGESSLALGGAFLGLGHGALIDVLATNGSPGKESFVLSTVTSIAETGIGYAVAHNTNMAEGTADVIRYCGLFGAVQGAGIGLLANNTNPSGSVISGLALAGSAGGFYAGTVLANNQKYSRGSASVLLTAGLFGTYITGILTAAAMTNSNFTSTDGRLLTVMTMAGNAGGVVLAHNLMSDKHYSTADGINVMLGTSAGYLIGTGVAYLILNGHANNNSLWTLAVPSVIGTVVGFALSVSTNGKGRGDDHSSNWKIDFNPGGFAGLLIKHNRPSNSTYATPIASVRYNW
ncbi:MAG TPA: hypothetical protein VEW28_04690 [Candidatus Kapabacteria bacterium]|nr:hypothetical protein [Candidatus Kapabacteria bacterium]